MTITDANQGYLKRIAPSIRSSTACFSSLRINNLDLPAAGKSMQVSQLLSEN
jgi:hypothetical protein